MIINRPVSTRIFVTVSLFIALIAALFGSSFGGEHIARAAGNTWIVTSLADDSSSNCSAITFTGINCELRDAIAQAAAGDSITFSVTGTIILNSTYGTLTLTKDVTITGPGAPNLAIDGNHAITVFHAGQTHQTPILCRDAMNGVPTRIHRPSEF